MEAQDSRKRSLRRALGPHHRGGIVYSYMYSKEVVVGPSVAEFAGRVLHAQDICQNTPINPRACSVLLETLFGAPHAKGDCGWTDVLAR